MITKLKIKNFRTHKGSVIDFKKGVNYIIGDNRCGKSNIRRAIRWVTDNDPNNTSVITEGCNEVSVILEINNHTIERKRTKSDNLYILDGKEYKSFGMGVPEDIQKVVNMNNINWDTQFESHFLLSETKGKVAEKINKIAKLDQLDICFKNLSSEKMSNNKQIKFLNEQIESYCDRLGKREELLESSIMVFKNAIETNIDLGRVLGGYSKLLSYIEQHDALCAKSQQYQQYKTAKILLDKVVKLYQNKEDKEKEAGKIDAYISKLQSFQKQQSSIENQLSEKNNIIELEKLYNSAKSKIKQIGKLDGKINKFKKLNERYNVTESALNILQAKLKDVDICDKCNGTGYLTK